MTKATKTKPISNAGAKMKATPPSRKSAVVATPEPSADTPSTGVDASTEPVVQSGFSVFNQPVGEQIMNAITKPDPAAVEAAKAEKEAKAAAAAAAKEAAAKAKAELAAQKAEAAQKAAAEKAEKTAALVAKREAEALAKAEALAAKKAKAAENAAKREAAIAALKEAGKNYIGSMLALAARAKSGAYVKSATGQMRSTDELAVALDAVPAQNVVALGTLMFKEENKYPTLNIGQQSMNYRNRMRGAIAKGTFTLDAVIAARDEHGYATGAQESAAKIAAREAKAKAKAEKEAALAAEKAAKAEAAAKAKADKEAEKAAKAEAAAKAKADKEAEKAAKAEAAAAVKAAKAEAAAAA